MSKSVFIAMSGGVDSSVAAALLLEQGYDVSGITMILQSAKIETTDATDICKILNIPHYIIDMRDMFKREIIDVYMEQYNLGLTPNPCVDCNRIIKFGALMRKVREMGADLLATGHYATIERNETEIYSLKRAADLNKDQSYFLYNLCQEQLKNIVFPLGQYTKEDIRAIAGRYGFLNAYKKDSQNLCFTDKHSNFIKTSCTGKPGFIRRLISGEILGKHEGIHNFTVGQRKGIGLTSSEALYVVSIDVETSTVFVGVNSELYYDNMTVKNCNFIRNIDDGHISGVMVKPRYRAVAARASIMKSGGICEVFFETPQRALTPGQSAVFYGGEDSNYVLGGGIIV